MAADDFTNAVAATPDPAVPAPAADAAASIRREGERCNCLIQGGAKGSARAAISEAGVVALEIDNLFSRSLHRPLRRASEEV